MYKRKVTLNRQPSTRGRYSGQEALHNATEEIE